MDKFIYYSKYFFKKRKKMYKENKKTMKNLFKKYIKFLD